MAVQIVSAAMVGRTRPVKTFVGRVVGGKLRFQHREYLGVKFRDPPKMRDHDLAFSAGRRALKLWGDIKAQCNDLKSAAVA